MASAPAKQATIYRMVMPEHTCPYGLKAKDLLRREGYSVEDHWLRTREETSLGAVAGSQGPRDGLAPPWSGSLPPASQPERTQVLVRI